MSRPSKKILLAQARWRLPLLLLAGAASAFAFAPFYQFYLLFFTFPFLVWSFDYRAAKGAPQRWLGGFFDAFCFSFSHLLVGLFWIRYAFAYDAGLASFGIPAVLLLAFALALFPATSLALAQQVWPARLHPARLLLFAGAWMIGEMLRGTLFTGFAWNPLGQVFLLYLPLAQSAAFIGVYGMSLLAVLLAICPVPLLAAPGWRQRAAFLALPLLLLAGLAVLGHARLAQPVVMDKQAEIRIIQPAIAQQDKLNRNKARENLARHLYQTRRALIEAPPALDRPVAVFWPEAALFASLENDELRRYLTRDLPPSGILVLGALRREQGQQGNRLFNSLYALDATGEVLAIYDKRHLVPFGEYLPMRGLFASFGLHALAAARGDIAPGQSRDLIILAGLPAFAPLICYEIIFPEEVPGVSPRPAMLVNLTNDGWYQTSSGPYQHFAQARMRAIEQGLPLLRSANTGISAMLDPYGRIVASLALEERGFLNPPLPHALPPTLYARLGFAAPFLLALVLALGFMARPVLNKRDEI